MNLCGIESECLRSLWKETSFKLKCDSRGWDTHFDYETG